MGKADSNAAHQLVNVRQRILATLENGKLTKISLVPDQGYIVTQEDAESMLPYLVEILLPKATLTMPE